MLPTPLCSIFIVVVVVHVVVLNVAVDPRNLPLKFGQIESVIAELLVFLLLL